MNQGIMSLILEAEKKYYDAIKKADAQAANYAESREKEQGKRFEELRMEWENFEKSENEAFNEKLRQAEQIKEKETAQLKEKLKICQEEAADIISERLKKEVLSKYGYS